MATIKGDDDDGREEKRQRISSGDPIIGLDVCGKVYCCRQSTLTSNSQYFASRLDGGFDADVAYQDQVGRDVYFVERSPTTFKYIFDYILSPHEFKLPSFGENPTLWRNLRSEADYFGIDGLRTMLDVTYSVAPNPGNRGLLYWLGTRRGTATYENPHAIGAIHVGGWVDGGKEVIYGYNSPRRAGTEYCRQRIVQHRLSLTDMSRTTDLTNRREGETIFYPSTMMYCSHGTERLPVTVDLISVHIRPTHFSLRSFTCFGMAGNWDFDGSCDGTTWDKLHAAREDNSLDLSGRDFQDEIFSSLRTSIDDDEPNSMKADAITSCIEKDFRHTWKLEPEPQKFYRYFRIIGGGRRDVDSERHTPTCLHGEGLELFGDLRGE